MADIQIRHTVESLYALKCSILESAKVIWEIDKDIRAKYDTIGGHTPYRIEFYIHVYDCVSQDQKFIDQAIWRYLVRLYNLEKFMLCTDFQKMIDEIDHFRTPDFTIENANGWIAGLKQTIRDNVNTLVKKVYSDITNGYYYTGNGYRGEKKKRNNNGIDKSFIIYTADWKTIFAYWSDKPTIMDDLEKVCYILDGKALPDKTLRTKMKADRKDTASNEYMSVKLCQNGNTHFTLEDNTRSLLNRYGPTGTEIGENIKIKVFER